MSTTKEAPRKFQFLRQIASGGFGSVYLSKVIHADGFSRLVAVKLLHKRWSENEEIASRMRDEARLLGWLRHRNIVEVLDLTLLEGRSAVVMEYLEAVDTRVVVDEARASGTVVPVGVALEVCASVASALDAAYNRPPYAGEKPLRVIHRDIKPSNVMIDENGVVKVLDFGVARADFESREAKTAELSFGSLEYMPPERLFFEPESPASDVYSLGSTLYEMVALEKLGKAKLRQSEQERFVTERFQDLVARRAFPDEVAGQLGEILDAMLAFDESDRPTAADLVQRMRTFGRTVGDAPIEEWAREHIPRLIERVRVNDEDEAGTLVGRTITEDLARPADGARAPADDDTGALPTEMFRPDDPEGPDSAEYTTGTGRDDARWSALKEATLASLSETGELNPRVVEEVRRGGATFEWLEETTEPEDGAPTVRIRPGEPPPQPTASPPERSPLSEDETINLSAKSVGSQPGRAVPSGSPPTRGLTGTPSQKSRRPSREPVPVDSVPPTEEGSSGGNLLGIVVSVGLLLMAAGVFLVAVLIIGGTGIAAFLAGPSRPVPVPDPQPLVVEPAPGEPVPVEPVEPVPVEPGPAEPAQVEPVGAEPAPEPAPAAPPSGPVFVSLMPDTKTLLARCDTGEAKGTGEVALDGAPKECTVTAVDARRNRRTAVVKGVKSRRYECFGGDDDSCR